jgi:Fe-S cluster assembly iron-binding protein IscA
MDQKQETIINITDNAAEKVKALMAQEGEEDLALRAPAVAPASSTASTSTTRSTTTTRSSRPRAYASS